LEQNKKARGRPLNSPSTKRGGRRASKVLESLPDSVIKEASEETISSISICGNYDKDFIVGAMAVDDINDLVSRMLTILPMGCWLEVGADYSTGKF